jgi:cytochrome P450
MATRLSVLFQGLFPPFKYLPLRSTLDLERARNTIRDTALSMIRRKQDHKEENDIVGVMIQENQKNEEEGILGDMLSEEEMVNHIMTFLAAGYFF